MDWEKLPLLGAVSAVLFTVAVLRFLWDLPLASWFPWDIFIYAFLGGLDIFLIAYKNTIYWRPLCYLLISISFVLFVLV